MCRKKVKGREAKEEYGEEERLKEEKINIGRESIGGWQRKKVKWIRKICITVRKKKKDNLV